jgi:hypothetical protein
MALGHHLCEGRKRHVGRFGGHQGIGLHSAPVIFIFSSSQESHGGRSWSLFLDGSTEISGAHINSRPVVS